jgi:hypothetical protein
MGMFSAASDRDYADECHGPYPQTFLAECEECHHQFRAEVHPDGVDRTCGRCQSAEAAQRVLRRSGTMNDERRATFQIIYPENGWRTGEQIIGYAKDHLATEYMRRNPGAEPAAIEENARVFSVADAMEVLESEGLMTFTAGSKALVRAE